MKINKKKIEEALLKKAIGYDFEETVEEFCVDENGKEMKSSKRRVSKKHSPPDITALKTLLSLQEESKSKYENMTEEELLNERARLLEELSK